MNRCQVLICLFAFMYQLGACPCGCADGNYWYQTLVQFKNSSPNNRSLHYHSHGHGHHHHHHDSDSEDAITSIDDHHNHDCAELAFVWQTRVRQFELHASSSHPVFSQPCDLSSADVNDRWDQTTHLPNVGRIHALPVRAMTAVFLL